MPSKTTAPDAVELIDHLYPALFGEAPWQNFVDRSCSLLPNGRTVLFYQDKTSGAGAMSLTAGLDAGMVKKFNDHYHSVNPWIDHAMIRFLGKVLQADEMLAQADLRRTEFFQDYLRPQDIETGLGVTLHRQQGLHVFFSIVSADATEEQIASAKHCTTLLVPHLYRAFRAQGAGMKMVGGLQSTSEGVLQIDARLQVVAADARALLLLAETDALCVGPVGRLICKDANLLACLQHQLSSEDPTAVQHVYVKRKEGALPLRICLYRPGNVGRTYLSGSHCFMRLEDPALSLPEGARRFCSIHGLTDAEAVIVSGIAAGHTLAQMAAVRKTSQETVRTQLKTIFWKTGCHRQADIIRQVAIIAQSNDTYLTASPIKPQ
ncbi:hypothetical protein E4L95_16840 [Paracoccus liaowanqingii]|uniref:HTH luxR-type domain-containing protein n=1 Tax=Paracoccus liaowanqingii TaxID=2560053 RepID=A0A4Z1C6F7_9RHOB|nr:hypothetical protein [Paracoccus liaowanqingii]TGN51326.1 hypothetical protein E4L95_16840 [Paracoccus liaowanqingii]